MALCESRLLAPVIDHRHLALPLIPDFIVGNSRSVAGHFAQVYRSYPVELNITHRPHVPPH